MSHLRAHSHSHTTLILIYDCSRFWHSVDLHRIALSLQAIKYQPQYLQHCNNVLITWKVNIFQRNSGPFSLAFLVQCLVLSIKCEQTKMKEWKKKKTFNCARSHLLQQTDSHLRIRNGRLFCCQYFISYEQFQTKNKPNTFQLNVATLVQLFRFHFDSSLKHNTHQMRSVFRAL